jgi:hypothetical protein
MPSASTTFPEENLIINIRITGATVIGKDRKIAIEVEAK